MAKAVTVWDTLVGCGTALLFVVGFLGSVFTVILLGQGVAEGYALLSVPLLVGGLGALGWAGRAAWTLRVTPGAAQAIGDGAPGALVTVEGVVAPVGPALREPVEQTPAVAYRYWFRLVGERGARAEQAPFLVRDETGAALVVPGQRPPLTGIARSKTHKDGDGMRSVSVDVGGWALARGRARELSPDERARLPEDVRYAVECAGGGGLRPPFYAGGGQAVAVLQPLQRLALGLPLAVGLLLAAWLSWLARLA